VVDVPPLDTLSRHIAILGLHRLPRSNHEGLIGVSTDAVFLNIEPSLKCLASRTVVGPIRAAIGLRRVGIEGRKPLLDSTPQVAVLQPPRIDHGKQESAATTMIMSIHSEFHAVRPLLRVLYLVHSLEGTPAILAAVPSTQSNRPFQCFGNRNPASTAR
jgi:hypothetical protein